MITIEDILNILKDHSKENDYFIVDININSKNKISVYVDSIDNMPISLCVKINKCIRKNLGDIIDDYELMVSTPGLDQPFKVSEQYKKNIGREVEVLLKDGRKFEGKLILADNEKVVIESEKKKKDTNGKKIIELDTQHYKMEDIKSIKVIIKI